MYTTCWYIIIRNRSSKMEKRKFMKNWQLTAYKQHPNSSTECKYHASGPFSMSNANIADCINAKKSIQVDEYIWSGTHAVTGT